MLTLMFFVWVLGVSLVTGLTRYVATFQSLGRWAPGRHLGWGQEGYRNSMQKWVALSSS